MPYQGGAMTYYQVWRIKAIKSKAKTHESIYQPWRANLPFLRLKAVTIELNSANVILPVYYSILCCNRIIYLCGLCRLYSLVYSQILNIVFGIIKRCKFGNFHSFGEETSEKLSLVNKMREQVGIWNILLLVKFGC